MAMQRINQPAEMQRLAKWLISYHQDIDKKKSNYYRNECLCYILNIELIGFSLELGLGTRVS